MLVDAKLITAFNGLMEEEVIGSDHCACVKAVNSPQTN